MDTYSWNWTNRAIIYVHPHWYKDFEPRGCSLSLPWGTRYIEACAYPYIMEMQVQYYSEATHRQSWTWYYRGNCYRHVQLAPRTFWFLLSSSSELTFSSLAWLSHAQRLWKISMWEILFNSHWHGITNFRSLLEPLALIKYIYHHHHNLHDAPRLGFGSPEIRIGD